MSPSETSAMMSTPTVHCQWEDNIHEYDADIHASHIDIDACYVNAHQCDAC